MNTRYLRLIPLPLILLLSSCIYVGSGWGDFTNWNDRWYTVEGSGYSVTEVRPVSDIKRVNFETQGELIIEVGETESLVVEAEDNLQAFIVTEVRDGELRIRSRDRNFFRNREPIVFRLTVRELDGLTVGSTGNVEAPDLEADSFSIRLGSTGRLDMGQLRAERVEIRASSTGSARLDALYAGLLGIHVSSTGNIRVDGGKVTSQDIVISSTGSYEAEDLESDVANVHIYSTGSAHIYVNDYLEAELNSTGDVRYAGNPQTTIERNSTGRAVAARR